MEYLTSGGSSFHAFFGSSVRQFVISTTASAVNYLQVTGSIANITRSTPRKQGEK